MSSPVYFTVEADYKSVVADSVSDPDADPQLGPVTATVTFTPVINTGDVILAGAADPRPTGFVPAPIVARIDTDGRLKLRVEPDLPVDPYANVAAFPGTGLLTKLYRATDTMKVYRWTGSAYVETLDFTPVRLLADTPLLELAGPLYYQVAFTNVVFNGGRGELNGFVFQAAEADSVINLIEVGRVAGQPAPGMTRGVPGDPVDDVQLVGGALQFYVDGAPIGAPLTVPTLPHLHTTLGLTATGMKSADYTAAAGEWVMVAGYETVTVTLPAAPPDKTVVDVFIYGSGGSVTLAAGGTDALISEGGPSTFTLLDASTGIVGSLWCYQAATGVWAPVVFGFDVAVGKIVGAGATGNELLAAADDAAALTALGLTATGAELNYVDGVTAPVQTQLDGKVPNGRTVGAGTGLAGGGDLSADRAVSLSAASQASLVKADTAVQPGGALGTPSSGNLTNCTFPVLNQNTTGSAAKLTTSRTFQTNLASGTAAGFDGTANNSHGVTGTLPVGNGGTGITSLTGLVKGNGAAAFSVAVAGTDYVAPGGVLGTPSSGNLANCTGYPAAAVVQTTRTGVYQFEHCNGLPAFNSLHTRRPFMITQTIKRFRLHIRNWDQIAAAYSSGALTGMTAYVGAAALDANGDPNGQFAATPTQIVTSTTLAAGAGEVVSGWITPGTFSINPYALYLISVGWTASSVPTASGGGMHWWTATPADAGVAAPAGLTRADNEGFLDMYIEYEYADDDSPSMLVVGNSLSGGGNVAGLANRGELDAWQQQWAAANGGWAASIAVGGGWTTHFGAASTRWDVYDGLAAPLTPDLVVFMGTSSSDISGGTTLSAAQADLRAAIGKAKTKWPGAKILLTTLPPRVATSAAEEIIRQQFNDWVSGCPSGTVGCVDIEPLLTDGGAQEALTVSTATALTLNGELLPRLHPDVDSGDHEHWRPNGHTRVAEAISLARRVS